MLITALKLTNKYIVICFISLSFFCSQNLYASREPIIRVLIYKEKNLRIRADGDIPLIFKYKNHTTKNIKGITLKKENGVTKYFLIKTNQKFMKFKGIKDWLLNPMIKEGYGLEIKDIQG